MARTIFAADAEATLASPAPTARVAPSSLRLYIILAIGVACIAFSAILTRLAGVPGTVSAFYRVAIAALVLAVPFARGVARGHFVRDRRVWLLAGVAGIFFALDIAIWNTSLFLTTAANATLLGNDAPLVVGLCALFFFGERLRPAYWIGLALALVGMGVIAGGDLLAHAHLGAGDLLALLAGVSYGGYLLTTQRIRAHMDTLSSLWIAGLVGAVLLLVVNLVTHRALVGFTLNTYLLLLALGLISQVAGWLAINYALGHLSASVVSVTLLGQPVLTALLAVPLLSEGLEPRQAVGGVVALAGIYLVNRAR